MFEAQDNMDTEKQTDVFTTSVCFVNVACVTLCFNYYKLRN